MKEFNLEQIENFQIGGPVSTTIEHSYEMALGRHAMTGLEVIEDVLRIQAEKGNQKSDIEIDQGQMLGKLADEHARNILFGSDAFRHSAQIVFHRLEAQRPELAERVSRRIDGVRRVLLTQYGLDGKSPTPVRSARSKSKNHNNLQ